ncbi:DUF4185 domain-containing protein [Mycolicibacterium monacense]|uniref:DUF4185 domain-containing protein n=1 Tax=Mycolicibacterium monacense TaxID=85693 RepID=UPI0007E97887|nr:DUF4185 domain-containing protein [Mycolicibacterium monacense]OBB74445.1 hypothetical protein A6B34_14375 [Mycolicibacterium monacense]OBF50750.1 hypothetical protein A5778_18180 [Mycolicibacterium monacense]
MDASAYIGRVGGLAVALGVGAAVMVGAPGTAFAETGEPTSQTPPDDSPKPAAEQDDPGQEQAEEKAEEKAEEQAEEPDPEALEGLPDDDGDEPVVEEPVVEEPVVEEPVVEEPVVVEDDAEKDAEGADLDVTLPIVDPTTFERESRNRPDSTLQTEKSSEPEGFETLSETADVASFVVDTAHEVGEQPAAAARTVLVDNVEEMVQTVLSPAAAAVTAITAPTAARNSAPVINRLLAAFGLGSLRNLPSLPSPAWALSALLALGSRRELERSVATRSVSTSTPTVSLAAAATPYDPAKDYVVTPVSVSGNTVRITNVTGPGGLNNTTTRFGIGGTDLGIMWDNGIKDNPNTAVNEHQVLIAFGDTFSNRTPVRTGVWRMNTLFRSTDTVLSNGMYVADGIPHDPGMYSGSPMSDPNFSREIIGNYHYGIGPEVTMIPTAAISVPGAGKDGATRQYINYMAVKSWDSPGRWTTNYSAIAYSDDNGQNWTVVPQSSVRPAAAGRTILPFVNGDQNFQQGAYVRKYTVDPVTGKPLKNAAGQEITDGYIYSYGTPAGRTGTAYVSRVAEADILDKTKYEYWNGTSWTPGNPAAAKPILPSTTTTSFFGLIKTTTYPTVSEMSVQYNSYEKKYIMLYGDKNNNIVMRKADSPEGPWSAPITLVTSSKMPGLYAPMIHPWSSTDNVSAADQQYLYWNLSTWDDYQVKLMRTDLTKV